MKRTIHTPLLLLAAAVAGEAQGQEVLFPTRDVGAISAQANNLSMSALDGQIIDSSPLFLEQRNPGGVASSFGGQVNGATLRGIDSKNVGNLSVGFDYLRPWWSFRDFNLTVPPAYAGSFPVLASIGNTDNHFAFVPRVQYEYYLAEWDLGIGGSGKVLNLQGSLQRNVATSGGLTGNLVSNNSLTIVSINPIEFSRSFTLDELFGKKDRKPCFADGKLDLTIGSRFVQLNQNYTGAVQVSGDGTSIASRYTSQSYSGFGLTSAMNWQCPIRNDFIGFSSLRASILAGENRRNSTLSINVTDLPGVAETIAEVKTQFVPIAEFEMGIEWGQDLGELLRNRQTRQQLTVRVSGLAQYWGGMGPLSAGSTQGFQTSDLFLGGVSVLVGFRH